MGEDDRAVAHDVFPVRLGVYDLAVAHLDMDRFSAVKTGGVDPDRLAREQPADR